MAFIMQDPMNPTEGLLPTYSNVCVHILDTIHTLRIKWVLMGVHKCHKAAPLCSAYALPVLTVLCVVIQLGNDVFNHHQCPEKAGMSL